MSSSATENNFIIGERLERMNSIFGGFTSKYEVISLEDLVKQHFTEYMISKPYMKDVDNVNNTYNLTSIITKIKSSIPSTEEIELHVKSMEEHVGDKLEGWLMRLVSIPVIDFEGEDPTIVEFCSDDFDSNRIKTAFILASYPVLKK